MLLRMLFFSVVVLIINLTTAQSIERQVVASGGDNFSNPAIGEISWTLGEIMTETFHNGNVLTQGFQQGDLGGDPTSVIPFVLYRDFTLFPNPTGGKVYFDWKGIIPATCILYDLKGSVYYSDAVDATFSELDLSSLPNGMYLMVVEAEDGVKYSTEIIKSHH